MKLLSPNGRMLDGLLTLAGVLLNAVLAAAVIAGAVWLLPGKLAVFLLGLYGFIVVWLLQTIAAFALLYMLARAVFGDGGDAARTFLLCGGFLIAVALCNAFILDLGHLWGRSFAVAAANVPLMQFLDLDNRVLAGTAAVGGLIDRAAVWIFHPGQPPVAGFFASLAAWIDSALPADALQRTGLLGFVAGLTLAAWLRMAKGSIDPD